MQTNETSATCDRQDRRDRNKRATTSRGERDDLHSTNAGFAKVVQELLLERPIVECTKVVFAAFCDLIEHGLSERKGKGTDEYEKRL